MARISAIRGGGGSRIDDSSRAVAAVRNGGIGPWSHGWAQGGRRARGCGMEWQDPAGGGRVGEAGAAAGTLSVTVGLRAAADVFCGSRLECSKYAALGAKIWSCSKKIAAPFADTSSAEELFLGPNGLKSSFLGTCPIVHHLLEILTPEKNSQFWLFFQVNALKIQSGQLSPQPNLDNQTIS